MTGDDDLDQVGVAAPPPEAGVADVAPSADEIGTADPADGDDRPGASSDAPVDPTPQEQAAARKDVADGGPGAADSRRPETLHEWLPKQQLGKPSSGKTPDEAESPAEAFNLQRGDQYRTRVHTVDGPAAFGTNAVSVQVKLGGQQITLTRYELTDVDLQQQRRRYVQGPNFPSALATLRTEGLVIVRGPDGSGRRGVGHALLERMYAEGRIVAVGGLVMPDGVVAGEVLSQSEAIFPAGWGLVLEVRDGADLADESTVEAYRTVVGHGGRGYVVLLGPSAGEAETSRYAVTHDWPDPAAVLERYLETELPGFPPDALRTVLTDEATTEYLAINRRPGRVVKLARALVEGLRQGKAAEEVVAALEPDWRTVARAAFEDALVASSAADPFGGPRRQALRTAYAIFDGIELVDVLSAAEQLLGMLRLVEAPDSTPARPVFDDGLEKLFYPDMLGDLGAGKEASPRRAQLRNAALSDAFLDVAWNDYDTTREVLLYWLDRVVTSGRPAMRLRAAQAVGKLAVYDFEKIMADLIRPWALDTNGMRRQAAAWALEQVGRNDRFVIRVRRRVGDWVSSNDPELHDTAARVYGTELGVAIPDVALRDLRVIAADPRQRAYRSVGRAVAGIYQEAGSAELVFDHVDAWLTDDAADVRTHATWAVLFLARLLGRDRPEWPQLLVDATVVPERLPALVRMWKAALADPTTAYPAWDLMRQWLELPYRPGGPHEDLSEALSGLVRRTLVDRRLRKRGLWHLRLWHGRRPEDLLLKELIDRPTED
ncbi:hypothetical protein [Micromonospora okii]|uniref:hypothetical protein n=1 Tax=Micromonospora okii TaxID=1182970 RepID=UPI001E30C168|nr:hypothetical protein [Micromonospora okii]